MERRLKRKEPHSGGLLLSLRQQSKDKAIPTFTFNLSQESVNGHLLTVTNQEVLDPALYTSSYPRSSNITHKSMDVQPSTSSGDPAPASQNVSTAVHASDPIEFSTNYESKVIGEKAKGRHYVDGHAVRIVTSNKKGEIVIIFVKSGNYYTLPGGDIEESEHHQRAGERKVQEETGCKVTVGRECIAATEEWRDDLHQLSYCYAAHLVEDTGTIARTDDELADGLQHEWISIPAAIEKMEACQPTSELGKFIKERDIFFVDEYAEQMEYI